MTNNANKTKACKQCGKVFAYKQDRVEYCSAVCRSGIDTACKTCGKVFRAEIRRKQKFCSGVCGNLHMRKHGNRKYPRKGDSRTCEVCSAVFEVKYIRWTRTCGRKCGAELRKAERARWQFKLKKWVARKNREYVKWLHLCEQCGLPQAKKGKRCKACVSRLSSRRLADIRKKVAYWVISTGTECQSKQCENQSQLGSSLCQVCRADKAKAKQREQRHRRRCRKYGGEYETGVNVKTVALRDGVKCAYCNCKTTLWSGEWEPTLRTLDHVIPLAAGGGHNMANVVIACSMCNSKKADNLGFSCDTP